LYDGTTIISEWRSFPSLAGAMQFSEAGLAWSYRS